MVHAHGTTAPRIRLKDFVVVAKPGIVVGNVCATIGGFFLASKDGVNVTALVGVAMGTLLVIAASCVVNNYLDRTIDRKMSRTRKRPSATGTLPFPCCHAVCSGTVCRGFCTPPVAHERVDCCHWFLGRAFLYTSVWLCKKAHTPRYTLNRFPARGYAATRWVCRCKWGA